MIQIIVSDLGKVLLPFDVEPVWRALSDACPECPGLRSAFQRVFDDARLGQGATEPEIFYGRLVDATRIGLPYAEFRRLWSDMFWEDWETIELIARAPVRERHILSNTNAIHWDWILERHGAVLDRFDRHWVSHEMGLEKPDPEIYRAVSRATGLPAEAHLFIDDIAENVAAAEATGMVGIVHTDAPALAREFARLGLISA